MGPQLSENFDPRRWRTILDCRFSSSSRWHGAVILLALSLWFLKPAFAQTCRWGSSVEAPPSTVSLRSYRGIFHSPARIAVDGDGAVYATDPRMGQVVVRDRYGRLSAVVEGFDVPMGIAVGSDGRIYVSEQGKGSVTVFDGNWNPLYSLGGGGGEFILPNDIAIDADSGWIYVSDSEAHIIKVYASDGGFLFGFGGKGNGPGQFNFPTGVYVTPPGVGPAVEVYVADQNNDRIQVLDRSGNFLRCIGGGGGFSFSKKFGRVQGLTGDAQGRLYVADAFQGYVQVFDPLGYSLSTVGSFGEGRGELRTPMDVVIDPYNRLMVTSTNTSRVESYGLDAFTDPHIVAAVVDIQPDAIKRSDRKNFISAYIEMRGYSLEQVYPASITANGVPALLGSAVIGDYDGDGIADLRVDFDAVSVLSTVPDGDVTILVSGNITDGSLFEGSDTLRVMPGGKKQTSNSKK